MKYSSYLISYSDRSLILDIFHALSPKILPLNSYNRSHNSQSRMNYRIFDLHYSLDSLLVPNRNYGQKITSVSRSHAKRIFLENWWEIYVLRFVPVFLPLSIFPCFLHTSLDTTTECRKIFVPLGCTHSALKHSWDLLWARISLVNTLILLCKYFFIWFWTDFLKDGKQYLSLSL